MWVNLNYTHNTLWVCEKPDGSIDPPLSVPLGKGQRFIILHAGSTAGFVPNGLYLFKSRSTKNYHEETDGQRFKEWFKNQLPPNIRPNSIIIIDNGKYHSVEINKAPILNNKKQELQDWLNNVKSILILLH